MLLCGTLPHKEYLFQSKKVNNDGISLVTFSTSYWTCNVVIDHIDQTN